MNQLAALAIACIATSAVEAALHWFPWNLLPVISCGPLPPLQDKDTGELAPPYTYIAGMAPILAALTIWLFTGQHTTTMIAIGAWTITASVGVTVFATYLIDRGLRRNLRAKLGDLDGSKGRQLTR